MNFAAIVLLLTLSCSFTFGSRILAMITSMGGPSHFNVIEPLLIELINRGHQVTFISNRPLGNGVTNYTFFDISYCHPRGDVNILPLDKHHETTSNIGTYQVLYDLLRSTECIFKSSQFQDFLKSEPKFDLVLVEYFTSRLFTAFGFIFKCPVVVFSACIMPTWVRSDLGDIYNPSFVPYFLGFSASRMDFLDRLRNTLEVAGGMAIYEMIFHSESQRYSEEYFSPSIPDLKKLVANVSLALVNTHYSYFGALPRVPGIIEVGGIHILKAQQVPENIEKFINESKHGVVYFCMGSLLRGETFPPEKREAFLYAFSKIPQRVLWKWEGDVLPGKSDNIMISKWMPQRDILAHPNVKLFISHGGLLGTSEAVYEGVPVLGIPIFGDQRTNIKSLEANGAGELLDYNEISKEVVLEKIQRLLNDPKYKENAKLLSDRYRDRPMSPLDTAVYWTEYVIRHKGAPHLRTAAADMPWYQYLLLDVIAFIVAVLVAGLLIIYYTTKFILRAIYGLICGGGAKKGSSKSDKKKRN
ncbi:UDP-glycosyltransferase UGT5-like isoform X28 [Planococcus citri]|uniref:UDP-glycosyltransferase UGT5-like isoform X28 n=1 Tax=Planococcus citri TaxID=170843 RepID=UPI0031F7EE89